MSNKFLRNILFTAVAVACSSGPSGSTKLATVAQRVDLGQSISTPTPIQIDPNNGYYPVSDPTTNKPKSAWDGNNSELLAADVTAQCMMKMAGFTWTHSPWGFGYGIPLGGTGDHITKSPCELPTYDHDNPDLWPQGYEEWYNRRTSSLCNYDPSTNSTVAAFDPVSTDTSSPAYMFMSWLTTHAQNNTRWYLNDLASIVGSAYVGLCVAEKLNETLDDAVVLATATDEHVELLAFQYTAAVEAAMQLGYLVKVIAKPESPPSSDNSTAGEANLVRNWLNDPNNQVAKQVIADYVAAVKVYISAMSEFAQYLERQAGARWTSASSASAFDKDWGAYSARGRLMNLVYGGGVWADQFGEYAYGAPTWFTQVNGALDDPRVTNLLSLARSANAILVRADVGTPNSVNGQQIFDEVEVFLRQQDCRAQGGADCTRQTLLSQLVTVASQTDYLLYRDYKITVDHANALAQSLFDAAGGTIVVDWNDHAKRQFDLSGPNTYVNLSNRWGFSNYWVRFDPNARLVPYAFGDRADRSFYGPCGTSEVALDWNSILPRCDYGTGLGIPEDYANFGAAAVLSFAREALFDLSQVYYDPDIDAAIASLLPTLERFTGSTTIIRRPREVTVIQPSSMTTPNLVRTPNGAPPDFTIAAKDPDYNSEYTGGLVNRTTLDGLTRVAPSSASGMSGGAFAGRMKVYWSQTAVGNWWPDGTTWDGYADRRALLLAYANGSAPTNYVYLSNGTNRFIINKNPDLFPPTISTVLTDGSLVDMVSRITSVQEANWSRPAYDGFGLLQKWVPPADASLLGGTAGDDAYAYLLQAAKICGPRCNRRGANRHR